MGRKRIKIQIPYPVLPDDVVPDIEQMNPQQLVEPLAWAAALTLQKLISIEDAASLFMPPEVPEQCRQKKAKQKKNWILCFAIYRERQNFTRISDYFKSVVLFLAFSIAWITWYVIIPTSARQVGIESSALMKQIAWNETSISIQLYISVIYSTHKKKFVT